MKYSHILSAFDRQVWAILEEKYAVMKAFLRLKMSGGTVSADEIALIKRAKRSPFVLEASAAMLAGAIPYEKSEAKDDSEEWDGAAAKDRLAKWASSDGSADKDKIDWAKYRKGFAWYDSDNAESFGSYKFPHHDVQNDKLTLVWGGVKAAMGALLGARGGSSIPESDRKPVYNHLAEHYKEFDKEPPEFHGEGAAIVSAAMLGGSPVDYQAGGSSTRTKDGSTIAVLPLSGTISHRMGMLSECSGGISTERFTQWLRAAAADPSVKAIVIDADSPGGTVDGVPELADEIYRTNKTKTVVGVANSMAASAAYWLLSQCDELVITPSGTVGSIGVFASHEDFSKLYEEYGVKVSLISAGKYKTEGNPYEPLSDDARQALQGAVNDYYDMFTKAVARGRNTDQKTVKAGFGEGRMVTAQQAVKENMADRVATLDQTLARLGAKNSGSKMALAGVKADPEDGDGPGDEENPDNLLDECHCDCKACEAGNCAECSNPDCDDQNCEHAESAKKTKGSAAQPANAGWKEKIAARRRQLQLL